MSCSVAIFSGGRGGGGVRLALNVGARTSAGAGGGCVNFGRFWFDAQVVCDWLAIV